MEILERLYTFFEQLDSKTFKMYALVAGLLYGLILCFFIYRHVASIHELQKRMAYLNIQREDTQQLLSRFDIVKNQQMEVDKLLEQNKDFKIGGFFAELTNKLGISKLKTREPEVAKELLDNGYTEVKLYASFNNMNMKTIATLLDQIEQNERIYTKEIEIYKPNGALNLNIIIATLEPKTEILEPIE